MEFLRAIEHKREADKAESVANQLRIEAKMEAKIDSSQEKMDAIERKMMTKMDAMQATMDSQLEETMACLGETKASSETTESCEGKSHACPLKTKAEKESAPEDTGTAAEPQEVPERATEQKTIEAAEDRNGEQRLAVGCRGRLKTRTKCDGRVRQVYATTIGRLTRRFIPALRKRGFRRGPGMKCCRSGLKGQSKAFRKGKRVLIEKGHLERRKALYDAVEPTLGLKIAKRVVGTSVRLREPGDWLLWKCRLPPKWKR
jgi:hypothetical protein